MITTVTMQSTKLLFLSICIPELCHSQEPFAGPYQILVRQIEQCAESGTNQVYFTSTRINKVSRTKYVYSTNLTSEVEMNDDIETELDIAVFGNGGWRPHYAQFEFPHLCSSLKRVMPEVYSNIVNALHSECPFPPGTYEIKELELGSFKIPSLPKLVYGKYRMDLFGRINGTLVGCFRYYCDIVPRKRERTQRNKKNNS